MDSTKGDKKRPYVPPKIYELEVDMAQAMGKSTCTTGAHASGQCANGSQAGSNCNNGGQAGATCDRGSQGRPPTVIPCAMGSSPSI